MKWLNCDFDLDSEPDVEFEVPAELEDLSAKEIKDLRQFWRDHNEVSVFLYFIVDMVFLDFFFCCLFSWSMKVMCLSL